MDEDEKDLMDAGVTFRRLTAEEIHDITVSWFDHFIKKNVKPPAKQKVYKIGRALSGYFNGYRRADIEVLSGKDAIDTYLKQWPAEYYAFGENERFGYLCSGPYFDFTGWHQDMCVAHKNMKWTVVHDHEFSWSPKDFPPQFGFNVADKKKIKRD